MSWDIFVQDLPRDAKTIDDIPDDFRPGSLNLDRSDLIKLIKELVPSADFTNPAWGTADTGTLCLEFNIGEDETVDSFAIHSRGATDDAITIAMILDRLNLRALDAGTGDFFSLEKCDVEGWKRYRDQVIGRRHE
jgi:hypothetical protein